MDGSTKKFDAEAVFDKQVAPLLDKIRDIVLKHGMHALVAINYSNDGRRAGMAGGLVSGDKSSCPREMILAMQVLFDSPVGSMTVHSDGTTVIETAKGGDGDAVKAKIKEALSAFLKEEGEGGASELSKLLNKPRHGGWTL